MYNVYILYSIWYSYVDYEIVLQYPFILIPYVTGYDLRTQSGFPPNFHNEISMVSAVNNRFHILFKRSSLRSFTLFQYSSFGSMENIIRSALDFRISTKIKQKKTTTRQHRIFGTTTHTLNMYYYYYMFNLFIYM